MKRCFTYFLLFVFSLGFSTNGFADNHVMDLDAIIEGFSNDDPALQYESRLELLKYVSVGTAPDKKDGAERVTEALLPHLKSFSTPAEAKKYIIRDLARVGTASAVSTLSRILRGRNEFLAEEARQALEQISDPEATAEIQRAIRSSSDREERRILIRTLANRKDPTLIDYFIEGLKSSDVVLAEESIYALAKLGSIEADNALENAYLKSSDSELKRELERAVVAAAGTNESTLVSIQKSGTVANRQAALTRLVEADNADSTNLLKLSLLDSDTHIRATAIRLALANGKESLVSSILTEFSGDDWRNLLGRLNVFDERIAESLCYQAIESGNPDVQAAGLRALGTYGTAKSVDVVLDFFTGDDKVMKQAAAYAIERMPGRAMDTRINKLFSSEFKEEILLGIELSAHRAASNAKNRLFRYIGGEDPELFRAVLRTLSTIADEEDLYRLMFIGGRSKDEDHQKTVYGFLKKLAPEVGSPELQAKVKAL